MIATVAVFASVGCARNVAQHAHSGKDHDAKGAREIAIEDGEGRARDIVTYPGGDRVDWKVVRLPEGQEGTLELRMGLTPARPGLDVAFDVYDEWLYRVARAKPASRGGKRRAASKRKKKVTIDRARGTYYVQIYAPRRTDAAAYTLRVRFREQKGTQPAGPMLASIEDPPPLPAVPAPAPAPPAPLPAGTGEAQGGAGGSVPGEVPPDQPAQPATVKASIVRIVATSGGVILTLNRGKRHGVAQGWNGAVLKGSSASPLDGGDFKIIKVSDRESVAKVKLSVDQFQNNRYVSLTPP